MQTSKLKQAFLHNGFKYIKVELEAHVMPNYDSEPIPCSECNEGRIECASCDESGILTEECTRCQGTGTSEDEGQAQEANCADCSGAGTIEQNCTECEGYGYQPCSYCNEGYIHEDDVDNYCHDFEQYFREHLKGIDKHFKFLKVYNDGSVDTECTLTLRVDYINELPEIIRIFKATCLHFGKCRTKNAGLHLTLLEGYLYPRQRKLNAVKMANYHKHVAKLLFGLIYLGSNGNVTRGFHCRDIRISDKEKYSAIYTHNDTCIEFRLFDTCYNHPERVLQYLALMAKTLRYYTDNPKKAVPIHGTLTTEMADRILKKNCRRDYAPLTEIYNSRQSRMRLFTELHYLLNDKARRVLADIARLSPCLMAPELFTIVKQYQ